MSRYLNLILSILSLCSGGLLVLSVYTNAPLGKLMLILAILFTLILSKLYLNQSIDNKKLYFKYCLQILSWGLLATISYDLSRFLLVKVFSLKIWPFEALPHFGALLVGETASYNLKIVSGTLYHFWNGIFFAVAYFLLFSGKPIFWAIGYAFFLEALMMIVYPSWLNINNLLAEFTLVSFTGHFFYGLVLGYGANKVHVKGSHR